MAAQSTEAFELKERDRIVFLGDTLIERAQLYGYIETAMTIRFPERKLRFRNLGWSADNPKGESRASFDHMKPSQGFPHLKEQIKEVDPTVVMLGYGMASSLESETTPKGFRKDYRQLIETVEKLAEHPVRFVLLSPIRHEASASPVKDASKHNKRLRRFRDVIQAIAESKGCRFVDLFGAMEALPPPSERHSLTDNGIHLNEVGYWWASKVIAKELRWLRQTWQVGILSDGTIREGTFGIKPKELEHSKTAVRFTGNVTLLPAPSPPVKEANFPPRDLPLRFQFQGLSPDRYTLLVDGEPIKTATSIAWAQGVEIEQGPMLERTERLRQAVIAKNRLYFHHWRPQNQTYLFGFRRHEQGQNAPEISEFEPLIAKKEERIQKLKSLPTYRFKIIPAESAPSPESEESSDSADAESNAKDSRSASPKQALPEFEVAEGFEVSLYAQNPLIEKPIQINFDPKGRLWVASSSVYPQIKPGQEANDKVFVLKDEDRDGKADQSTVFADGLLIPTGVEPGDGGAYVAQSTQLLHLQDTDGDGRADKKEIELSGFGTEDTHHLLHTLHWGHDGRLYMNQSIYIHSHIETPHGVVRLNSGGIFRYDPARQKLGVFIKGLINPWGHQSNELGQSFVSDGAGFEGLHYAIPGAMYPKYAGARRTLKSISPGRYPKYCGLEVIDSEHFPGKWQGDLITCDFRAHRVVRFQLHDKGAGYVTEQMPDLLQSTNLTFRPVDAKLGPDGALYIADWSNPIIQHGEVDFRDPRRDHHHGRIWRVTAKDRPLIESDNYRDQSTEALLQSLLSPNAYTRTQAKRVLIERAPDIGSDLQRWANDLKSEKDRLRALWLFQGMNRVNVPLLKSLLQAEEGRVRAAATRVLGHWQDAVPGPLDLLAEQINDPHPRVRLESLRALKRIPSARSARLALSVLNHPMDRFLDYGAWLTINDLAQVWVDAVKSGRWNPQGKEEQLEFALKAIPPRSASEVLSRFLDDKTLTPQGDGPWIELVGDAGTPNELQALYDRARDGFFEAPATVRALKALRDAKNLRDVQPARGLEKVGEWLGVTNEAVRLEAIRLVRAWRVGKAHFTKLVNAASDRESAETVRRESVKTIRSIGGDRAIEALKRLSRPEQSLALRRMAAVNLTSLDRQAGLDRTVRILQAMEDKTKLRDFWRALFNIQGITKPLAERLSEANLSKSAARTGMQVAREGGRNKPELLLALAKAGDVSMQEERLSSKEMKQFADRVMKRGDPYRGEAIYRRPQLACTACHAIGGVGGQLGPDLTSIGASSPVDYLIEAVLYPNASVKEGYHAVSVETRDGRQYSGVLAREGSEALVIRTALNHERRIPKRQIERRTVTEGSLMPAGLIESLDLQEKLDLFRFLAELGQPGPFDASQGKVARVWWLNLGTVDTEQFGDKAILKAPFSQKAWTRVETTVDGRLRKQQFREKIESKSWRDPRDVYAATQIEIPQAGKVELSGKSLESASLFIAGNWHEPGSQHRLRLDAGTSRVILRISSEALPAEIKLKTDRGTFLTSSSER